MAEDSLPTEEALEVIGILSSAIVINRCRTANDFNALASALTIAAKEIYVHIIGKELAAAQFQAVSDAIYADISRGDN